MENNFRLAGDKTDTNNATLFLTTYNYLEVHSTTTNALIIRTTNKIYSFVSGCCISSFVVVLVAMSSGIIVIIILRDCSKHHFVVSSTIVVFKINQVSSNLEFQQLWQLQKIGDSAKLDSRIADRIRTSK